MSLRHKPASSVCIYRVPYCVFGTVSGEACDTACVQKSEGPLTWAGGLFTFTLHHASPGGPLCLPVSFSCILMSLFIILIISPPNFFVACSLSLVSSLTHQPKVFSKTGPSVGFLSPPLKTFSRVLKCYSTQAEPGGAYLLSNHLGGGSGRVKRSRPASAT